jgi:hypothetical protein
VKATKVGSAGTAARQNEVVETAFAAIGREVEETIGATGATGTIDVRPTLANQQTVSRPKERSNVQQHKRSRTDKKCVVERSVVQVAYEIRGMIGARKL